MSSQGKIYEILFLVFIFFRVGDRVQGLPCTHQALVYG